MIDPTLPPEVKMHLFIIEACDIYKDTLPYPLSTQYMIRLWEGLKSATYAELDVILNSPLPMPAEGEYWVDQVW